MARQGEAKTLEEQEIRFAVPTRGRLMMDLLISYLPGLLALTVQVALLVLVGRFWIVLNNAETRWVEREKPLRDANLNPKGLAEAKGAVQKQSERIPEAEKPDDKNLQPQNEAFQSPPPTGSKSVDKSSVESLSKSPRCMHDIDCRDCKIAMHAMLAIRQVFDRAVDKHTLVVVLGNSPELNTWWSGKLEPYLQRNARGHYKFLALPVFRAAVLEDSS